MYRPQKLVAAFFSAALLCTTGIALADKGGNHDKQSGSSHGSSSAPGQSSSASAQHGPGGMGAPRTSPGNFDRSMMRNQTMGDSREFEGSADGAGAGKAGVQVKLANGATHDFDISSAALNSLKARQGRGQLIFFTNGQQITAVCARGEKDNMRVVGRNGDTFMLQDQSGQTRLITLDSKTANRLHVKVGANLQVTAMSATSGKVVALDLVKNHGFDKFARGVKSDVDVDVAKADVDRAKTDIDVAKTKKAKKADIDVVKADIDAVKTDIDSSKAKKSKKLSADVAKLDNDERDLQASSSGCGHGSSRNGNPAFANQMAKDAANDASGHNPPGLPHECVNPGGHTRGFCKSSSSASICGGGSMSGGTDLDVASTDVDTKGSKAKAKKTKSDVDVAQVSAGMGKCGHGSSRNGNPAYANQMAKDAANDASGHNPPGLPHECVNPAGHTRGFCKSSSSESICGGGVGAGGGETDVAANTSKPCAPGTSSKNHSNPAYANQMAKDAANDASGHNPPGLPHECVNPAGHTRGFCKSGESTSSAMCGGGTLGGGVAVAAAGPNGSGGSPNGSTPVRGGFQPGAANGSGGSPNGGTTVRGFQPGTTNGSGGSANAGTSVRGFRPGVVPVGRGATGAPTHVLGASSGPTNGRRIASLPTRVLPVAIQPVGKRRCVWYKTGVLGASTGPRYIVGTSAISGKPVLHKKCH